MCGGLVMAKPLINVPAKAKRGEVIEIKPLVSHVMETGFRHSNIGEFLPRDIITQFVLATMVRKSSAPTCSRP